MAKSYYTERHGMRKPVSKTNNITPEVYSLLLKCCERYYNNIAWKYPNQCPDGLGCCGLDQDQFDSDLKYEIPSLFRDSYGQIAAPTVNHSVFREEDTFDEYDQYALLDLIEFFAKNCRDVTVGNYHSYFGHYHLSTKTTSFVFKQYQDEINSIFKKTGLLYILTDEQTIERVVEDTPLTLEVEQQITQDKEKGTRDLLTEAIALFRQPYPESARDAVEKTWDALERLKSYYTTMDKKASASKIVNDIADGNPDYIQLFDTEFGALSRIGNNFRIRHHETNKIEITDRRYYDYFFNRCLSLIALAIQFLK